MRNHYSVLGLQKKASQKEVVSAYKLLAKKFHPDRNQTPGAHEKFIEIHEAYSILKDPGKRYQYDRTLLIRRPERNDISNEGRSYVYDPVQDQSLNSKVAFSTPFVLLVSFLGIVFTSMIGMVILAAPAVLYFVFDFIPGIPARMFILVLIALPYWYLLYRWFDRYHRS